MSRTWFGKTQTAGNWAPQESLAISVSSLHVTTTTRRLQPSNYYNLAQGSQSTYHRREKESQVETYDIVSEVTCLHFCSILSVGAITKVCLCSRGRKIKLISQCRSVNVVRRHDMFAKEQIGMQPSRKCNLPQLPDSRLV